MPGRHRLKGRRTERTAPYWHAPRQRAVELVDAQTGLAHLLTDHAFAAGRLPRSRYIAMCGHEVLPVSLTETRAQLLPVLLSPEPGGYLDSGSQAEVIMTWYLKSLSEHDTHKGHLRRGRVLAVCGVKFSPLRALTAARGRRRYFGKQSLGAAPPGEPSNPDQICPTCCHVSLIGESSAAFQTQAAA